MPLQNRVDPMGNIIAVPERGTMMGNRGGRLHDASRTLQGRRWASLTWICCKTSFKDRQRQVMSPRSYTELFFLDEATALAAGHRPCAECRREDFLRFARLWAGLWGSCRGAAARAMAGEMDQVLHRERLAVIGCHNAPRVRLSALPPGSMIRRDGVAYLVSDGWLQCWSAAGYSAPQELQRTSLVELVTPPSIVAVLAAGYRPQFHPTAESPAKR